MQFLKTFALAALFIGASSFAMGMEIRDGDQIAVLSGQGFPYAWSPSGYLRLLTDELAKAGVKKAPWIFLDGQKTGQMLERLDGDVIAKKPVLALIIPGAADYNSQAQKTVDAPFTKNLEAVIAKLQEAHIRTILVTSYAQNNNLALPGNVNVGEHNDAIRALAKEHGLTLIDFVTVVDSEKKLVPFDGSPAAKALEGQMFAGEVLRALGYSDQEIAACRNAWLDTPGAIQFPPSVSVNTYEKLKAAAKASGVEVGPYMTEILRKGLSSPSSSVPAPAPLPTPTPLTKEQKDAHMAWWREAKFGLFVHWGLYAIPADGEWHMRNHKTPFAEYSKLADQFNPTKFNADEWMQIAQDAGMKYLVFTTKHHDGFAMFDSKASDYNIVARTPFKRDPLKELSLACPRHGIRFGVYYSALADWGHPGGGAGGDGHWDKPAQDGDMDTYIDTVAAPQVRELMTNYGPIAEIWYDTDGAPGQTPERAQRILDQTKSQPDVLNNGRLGRGGDFGTYEGHRPAQANPNDWEYCDTLVSGSWGYINKPAKPLDQLLRRLVEIWSRGGNVLLNVGPTPEGTFAPDNIERLQAIGKWLKTNGESIYGSTCGPLSYLPWGYNTRKGSMLYLQVFDWPKNSQLTVPLSSPVKKAWLLADPSKPLTFQSGQGKLVINVPSDAPDAIASVVAVECDGAPAPDESLALNCKVTASDNAKQAAALVDNTSATYWELAKDSKDGWVELDLGKPCTFDVIRIGLNGPLKAGATFQCQEKEGGEWKTLWAGDKIEEVAVLNFPSVTATKVRMTLKDVQSAFRMSSLELFSTK